MFESLKQDFINEGLLTSTQVDKARLFAESLIDAEDIINHRSRKYIFGGAVLFFCHNKTEKVYRPSTIADQLGEDFSPSKLTVSAYRIGEREGEDYEKPTSRCFAHEFATELDCTEDVFFMIDELYEDVGELPGKSNSGSGAAMLYIASLLANDKRTQAEIAEVSGRSEVGIRNLYYEIVEESTLDVDSAEMKITA